MGQSRAHILQVTRHGATRWAHTFTRPTTRLTTVGSTITRTTSRRNMILKVSVCFLCFFFCVQCFPISWCGPCADKTGCAMASVGALSASGDGELPAQVGQDFVQLGFFPCNVALPGNGSSNSKAAKTQRAATAKNPSSRATHNHQAPKTRGAFGADCGGLPPRSAQPGWTLAPGYALLERVTGLAMVLGCGGRRSPQHRCSCPRNVHCERCEPWLLWGITHDSSR